MADLPNHGCGTGDDATACRCPLCGGDNACALARGCVETPCWCAEAVIPGRLLAQIPPAAKGKACICAACVQKAGGSVAGGSIRGDVPAPGRG